MVQFDTGTVQYYNGLNPGPRSKRGLLVEGFANNLQTPLRSAEATRLPGSGMETIAILHQHKLAYRAFYGG